LHRGTDHHLQTTYRYAGSSLIFIFWKFILRMESVT
jgi:hypothetical protein